MTAAGRLKMANRLEMRVTFYECTRTGASELPFLRQHSVDEDAHQRRAPPRRAR